MVKSGEQKDFYRLKQSPRSKWIIGFGIFAILLPAVYFLWHNLDVMDLPLPSEWLTDEKPTGKTPQDIAHYNKKKLMKYFKSIYGRKILSGQHVSRGLKEIAAIYKVTGKKPAILGLDFMDYSPSRVERGAKGIETEAAIKWWREGGIITFCWHWNAPMGLIDRGPDRYWYDGYNTKATTFNFVKGVNDPESQEYRLMIRDIDVIAEELKKIQKEGAPVLWRPLHEASSKKSIESINDPLSNDVIVIIPLSLLYGDVLISRNVAVVEVSGNNSIFSLDKTALN